MTHVAAHAHESPLLVTTHLHQLKPRGHSQRLEILYPTQYNYTGQQIQTFPLWLLWNLA